MVFRKPYAFFIKVFKPIHLALAFLLTYLIYVENNMLAYFNGYIYSTSTPNVNINILIYIIPAIMIVTFVLIFGLMYSRKKPYKFYVINIFAFIVVIIINAYTSNFLSQILNSTVPVRLVKLSHDLTLINIIIEIVIFIYLIIRGLGIDIKKFDFSSDLLKLDINDEDKEEIEVNVNIDVDLQRRKRKNKIRNLKYKYLEKKLFYNIILSFSLIFLIILGVVIFNISYDVEKQDYVYSSPNVSMKIDNSYIIDKNYKGNNIDNLVVVDLSMLSINSQTINLSDFSLMIENVIFKPTTKYNDSLIDVGIPYGENKLSNSYENYLIIFDVPEKYMESKMIFKYSTVNNDVKIKLNPVKLEKESKNISYKLGDEANLNDSLGDVKFKVTEFDIQNNYVINYDYCNNNYCLLSKEYLKPSIDQNFDKSVMRLKVEFSNNSNISIKSFYELLSKFGSIMYDTKIQKKGFEDIKSKRKNTGYVYIGVNNEMIDSNNIKLIFNIRNVNIEYVLRGES